MSFLKLTEDIKAIEYSLGVNGHDQWIVLEAPCCSFGYIEQKQSVCAPSSVRWIYIMVVTEFFGLTSIAFKSLQENFITTSLQRASLLSLQTLLLCAMGRRGPLSELEIVGLDDFDWVF